MMDKEQEYLMFLLFRLNRFIFPNFEGFVQQEYVHRAESLHNEDDVATGPVEPTNYLNG